MNILLYIFYIGLVVLGLRYLFSNKKEDNNELPEAPTTDEIAHEIIKPEAQTGVDVPPIGELLTINELVTEVEKSTKTPKKSTKAKKPSSSKSPKTTKKTVSKTKAKASKKKTPKQTGI